MTNPHDAHVDAVRVLKTALKELRDNQMMGMVLAEEILLAVPPAIGNQPIKPESARMIWEWAHSLPADIDHIITALDNTNEQCDLYLRGLGESGNVT